MSTRIRLDFATKQLEMSGSVLGRFVPASTTEGVLQLEGSSYTYIIRPFMHGARIELYRSRRQVAVRVYDSHDGVCDLCVGEDVAFDLDKDVLYCAAGPAGTVAFAANELNMKFNSLVPAECLGLVAALVALDTMWANLVGFTRTRQS